MTRVRVTINRDSSRVIDWSHAITGVCGSSLLKKKNSTRLGQLRESTGEFGRSAQGTPKLTVKKLRPARFRSTSRSVLLSDENVFTNGFIKWKVSSR